MRLTKTAVENAKPDVKRYFLWDETISGFGLVVHPSGKRTYILNYRSQVGGRTAAKRRITIGQHGSPWTPDTARREAQLLLGKIAGGEDPALERRDARQKQLSSVRDAFGDYLERYAQRHQKSWKETNRVFEKDLLPVIGHKPLDELKRRDIARLIDHIAATRPVLAARARAYLSKFLNWSVEQEYIAFSPLEGLKPNLKPNERDRVLNHREIKILWMATEKLESPWRQFVRLLFLTGQRRGEIAGLMHEEIDYKEALICLDAQRTKNGQSHRVPLGDLARQEIASSIEWGPYIFTTNGQAPISALSQLKRKLDGLMAEINERSSDKCVIENWTWHDLRRSFATEMAKLGIAPHVVEALLNHRSGTIRGVARIYNRHDYLAEARSAIQKWEALVKKLTK